MEQIDKVRLEAAYKIAAQVVALYGDAYLPVFTRLHTEMKKMQQQDEMREIALNLVNTEQSLVDPIKSG